MSVEKHLQSLENQTSLWHRCIEMRAHRDMWRRYAYTGKMRPTDSVTDKEGFAEHRTIIDILKRQLDETTALLLTFEKREKDVLGSPGSPFAIDKVLLDRVAAQVKKNMELID